jgi:hypothetical protein
MKIIRVWMLIASVTFAANASAAVVTLSGQSFDEISGPEILTPAFNLAGGQTTVNTYTGLVEILVSGTGSNDVNVPNDDGDAFYEYDASDNQAIGLTNNALRIGSQTQIATIPGNFAFVLNNSEREEAGSLSLANLAIAYDGSSFAVTDQNTVDAFTALAPDYSPDHTYHLVIDLGSYSGTLTLGNGDGDVSDNSATDWNVSLWQVVAVPEPSSIILWCIGTLTALVFAKQYRN